MEDSSLGRAHEHGQVRAREVNPVQGSCGFKAYRFEADPGIVVGAVVIGRDVNELQSLVRLISSLQEVNLQV